MKIRVLGAHNIESSETKFPGILIDDTLALDAGSVASSLSFEAQSKIDAVFLTHYHFDHMRDIPALAMNAMLYERSVKLFSTQTVCDALLKYLMNGDIYPNFLERPPQNPAIRFTAVEAGLAIQLKGYGVLPVTLNHSVPAVGYQVTSPEGGSLFYTGDTGPGLADCWRQVSPQALFIEVTAPNRWTEFAREAKHMTPALLEIELRSFREIRGYLPRVIAVHMNPRQEKQIAVELAAVAGSTGCSIEPAHEGMQVSL